MNLYEAEGKINNSIGFSSLHPLTCMIYYTIFIILSMVCLHPVSLMLLLFSCLFHLRFISPNKKIFKSFKYFLLIALFLMFINPLFNERGSHVMFTIFSKNITLESFLYGFNMALSLLVVLSTFINYQIIIDYNKFLYVVGGFVKKTAFIITMTIRYIPMLKKRSSEIYLVHNINSDGKKFVDKLKDSIKIISILMTWSFENAITTADSMKARGYGLYKRTNHNKYYFNFRDFVFLSIIIISGAFIVFFRINNNLNLTIYPSLMITLNKNEILAQSILFLFAFLPILLDIKEKLEWHYTMLKN